MRISRLFFGFGLLFLALMLTQCGNDSSLDPVSTSNNSDGDFSLQKNSLPNNIYQKVFRAGKTIIIDGKEDEWAGAPKNKMREYFDLGDPIDNKFDLSAYYKILWDDENLYVFINILDDDISVDADPGEPWNMDSFELFMDADNSKNAPDEGDPPIWPGTYDANDDQIRFVWQQAAVSARGNYDVSQFEYAYFETAKGWNVEIRMPFDAIQMATPAAGHVFGIEFHVNDNDFGERHNFLKWWSESDNTYLYPSLFGNAYLFDSIAE